MFNAVKPSLEKENIIKFDKSIIVNKHKIGKKNMVRSKRRRVSFKPVEEEKSILQTWASTVCEGRVWARPRRSGQDYNEHWW